MITCVAAPSAKRLVNTAIGYLHLWHHASTGQVPTSIASCITLSCVKHFGQIEEPQDMSAPSAGRVADAIKCSDSVHLMTIS